MRLYIDCDNIFYKYVWKNESCWSYQKVVPSDQNINFIKWFAEMQRFVAKCESLTVTPGLVQYTTSNRTSQPVAFIDLLTGLTERKLSM